MQQFSRVLSNYRMTFIGKKKTKTKTNKLKRSILLGYCPQSQAFWIWDGEVTKLKWSGYIVIGCRAGLFWICERFSWKHCSKPPPKRQKIRRNFVESTKKEKKTGGSSFMWVNTLFVACNMDFCVDVPLVWFPRTKMCRWNNDSKCGKKSMCRFIWVRLKYNYCTRGIWFVFSTNCCSNGSK